MDSEFIIVKLRRSTVEQLREFAARQRTVAAAKHRGKTVSLDLAVSVLLGRWSGQVRRSRKAADKVRRDMAIFEETAQDAELPEIA